MKTKSAQYNGCTSILIFRTSQFDKLLILIVMTDGSMRAEHALHMTVGVHILCNALMPRLICTWFLLGLSLFMYITGHMCSNTFSD